MPSPSSKQKNAAIAESIHRTHQRRKTQTCHVYKLKIQKNKLTVKQKEQLKMLFVQAKWIRNECIAYGQIEGQSIFDYLCPKKHGQINVKIKDEFQVRKLQFIGSQMIQAVVDEVKSNAKTLASLKKAGHEVGRLKFCSEMKAVNLKQFGNTYQFKGRHWMKLQGISGLVYVNGTRQLDFEQDEFANARILNTPRGYYVAVTVFKKKKDIERHFPEIGIDFGCKDNIVVSDGRRFNCRVEETERLRRLQRRLRKRRKGSSNYGKTCGLIRREYQKMTNRKLDMANKIVHELLLHEKVYMQDQQLAGWQKEGHGKVIQHSFLGLVKAKLMRSRNVMVVGKYVPTTKVCACGHVWPNLTLKDRILSCPVCGLVEDRDVHAARMMIVQGRRSQNLVRRGPAEFKPVDLPSGRDETGSSQPLG